MGLVTWGGLGYLSTGYIDIAAGPEPNPAAQVFWPPISGQTDVDVYVNQYNLLQYILAAQTLHIPCDPNSSSAQPGCAALDVFTAPSEIPVPCQVVGTAIDVTSNLPFVPQGWGAQLADRFAGAGGTLIAARLTCEGTHHVLGLPTLFRYRLYVLHDEVGVAIVVGMIAIVMYAMFNGAAAQRLAEIGKTFGPSSVGSGFASPFVWLAVAGGVFAIALYLIEKGIASPGQVVGLPSLPGIPSITTPAANVSVAAPLGPASVSAGGGFGGAGGGRPSRRRR